MRAIATAEIKHRHSSFSEGQRRTRAPNAHEGAAPPGADRRLGVRVQIAGGCRQVGIE